ncbi:MAG: hypothetical protein DRJ11_09080 [Candidatus Aminicenantes bacterium]|nr:MAG: hypothetical protein DRJ11_09080 [Candidatus Aminicenantes bacterium]
MEGIMTPRLRINISGIRGVVPEALNVEVAARLAAAYATYLEKGEILVCRDTRETGLMLQMAICASIQAAGLTVIDYGQLPTPFLQFELQRRPRAGGIVVSAGHNPLPWNAIIFLNERGRYLESNEGAEVFNIYEANQFQLVPWNKIGQRRREEFDFGRYLQSLGREVNLAEIRRARFKIVLDACNGAASPYLESFCEFFGCECVPLNNDPAKPFPHPPEPGPVVSAQVEAVVKATRADLGVLFNSDASRASFVDEQGQGLSEEMTFPLCLLSRQGKTEEAVTTVVTSRWADWAAQEADLRLLRTRVGQSAVVQMMAATGVLLGGEGSGSVVWQPFSPGYDGWLALAFLLELMSRTGEKLSQLVSKFPPLVFKKLKIDVAPEKMYRLMDRLEKEFAAAKPDLTDGLTIVQPKIWFNVRPSSTEFILRVFVEGEEAREVEETAAKLEEILRQ